MADDKDGRENQARAADRRRRTRALEAELERGDEPEPPADPAALDVLESDLEDLSFPATGAVADWVVDRIGEKETLPGSRAVRRRAAKECRSRGYSVSVDDWLGI